MNKRQKADRNGITGKLQGEAWLWRVRGLIEDSEYGTLALNDYCSALSELCDLMRQVPVTAAQGKAVAA